MSEKPGLFRSYGQACVVVLVGVLCLLVIIVIVAWAIGRVSA